MVRTQLVHIEKYDAFACRQKLLTGGIGVCIYDRHKNLRGVADIDRKTGKAVRAKKEDTSLPDEAFAEAAIATRSLPYYVLAPVDTTGAFSAFEQVPEGTPCLKESIIARFDDFVDRFAGSDGKFSQQKINLNFIQYVSRSNVISSLINTEGCTVNDVMDYIIKVKAAETARLILPANGYVEALVDMLSDLCGQSVFHELQEIISARLNKAQKKR